MKIFSERIKKLRIDKELSQAKLARALKTYQQTVDRWEKGALQPDLETLTQIAMFFDVTTDYLLGLHDNPAISYNSDTKPQKTQKYDISGAYGEPAPAPRKKAAG
jgi:transcriptional regulator with XRE-family HTH domain